AIRTMKRLQPEILEKHAAILSRLLADEDWNVRLAALSALARLEPLKLSHYAEAIQDRCGDEVHQVSELAQKVWARKAACSTVLLSNKFCQTLRRSLCSGPRCQSAQSDCYDPSVHFLH
ncbi:unnamed protein product, partial [Durusdinium trenchii]